MKSRAMIPLAALMLTIVSCALVLTTATGKTSTQIENSRCEVALTYVEGVLSTEKGKALVFSNGIENVHQLFNEEGWFPTQEGKQVSIPPRHLLSKAAESEAKSAIAACPMIRNKLSREQIPFGARAVRNVARTAKERDFKYRAVIIAVSLPIVADDETRAVLYSSRVSGPLAGGAYIHYLKRLPSGAWVVVASKTVAVA